MAPPNGSSAPGPPPQLVVPGAGWVDVASRAIVQVGFPVVVAGVLLWFLLTRFQENMLAITSRMAANTEAASRLIDAENATLSELRAQSAELQQQTAHLASQGAIMRQIQEDAASLVRLRSDELAEYRRRKRTGGPEVTPP